jgi:hypothetical protein
MDFVYTLPNKSIFKREYSFLTDILGIITEKNPFDYDHEYYSLRDEVSRCPRPHEFNEVIRNIKNTLDDADEDWMCAEIYNFDAGLLMLSLYHHIYMKFTPQEKSRLSSFLKTRIHNFQKGLKMFNLHLFKLKYGLSMRIYMEYLYMKKTENRFKNIITPYLYTKKDEDETEAQIQKLSKRDIDNIELDIKGIQTLMV